MTLVDAFILLLEESMSLVEDVKPGAADDLREFKREYLHPLNPSLTIRS
jgi:hypothetical protein